MEQYSVTGSVENWIRRVGELRIVTSSQQSVGHTSFLMLRELQRIRCANSGPGKKCVCSSI
jgi:hypothetical protein